LSNFVSLENVYIDLRMYRYLYWKNKTKVLSKNQLIIKIDLSK